MSEANENNPVVLFGNANFRNQALNFGIKMVDRRRHMYVIGKTGMGKSEMLKNIAIQDIQDGRGLAFLDPHGDVVDELLDYIPEHRLKDVIYLNPADLEHPIAFNVMEQVSFEKRHLVADGMMAVFKKIWVDAWSARMEYILNNTILALLESPGSTLLGINRMLADKEYRKQIVNNVTDPEVKAFWTQEFAKYTDKFASEATAAIQNKIGQFISNALIRNIVGQPQSSFDMRKAMDDQKILLVDISKGRIGEDASRLLGALLITKIQLGAMSRVDIDRGDRKDFVLIVDEFQNFATASFANILSEARKFNLSLLIAHQYVKQMEEEVGDAVFGNVGTIVSFRVGAEDAELLEKEFSPEFLATDIVNLGMRQIYLKLMMDGVASRPFSAMTMDTIKRPEVSFRDQVVENSRATYSHNRKEVEEAISEWRAPMSEPIGSQGGGRRDGDHPRPQGGHGGSGERRDDDRPRQNSGRSFGDRQSRPMPSRDSYRRDPNEPRPVSTEAPLSALSGVPAPIKISRPNPVPSHQNPSPQLSRDAIPPKVEVDRDELRKLLHDSLNKEDN